MREYAIFDPEGNLQPPLQGYRRAADGAWARWPAGARGDLASAVLGLTLVADGALLRLEDAGRRLPTPDEERLRAEQERARAEAAEARLAALQAQLDRLQAP